MQPPPKVEQVAECHFVQSMYYKLQPVCDRHQVEETLFTQLWSACAINASRTIIDNALNVQ